MLMEQAAHLLLFQPTVPDKQRRRPEGMVAGLRQDDRPGSACRKLELRPGNRLGGDQARQAMALVHGEFLLLSHLGGDLHVQPRHEQLGRPRAPDAHRADAPGGPEADSGVP